MLLTKTWTIVLAALATTFLAGMFLLSIESSEPFPAAERATLRAVASAGIAALEADIQTSPVNAGLRILANERIDRSLRSGNVNVNDQKKLDLSFQQVANEGLLNEYPELSLGLVRENGEVISKTGISFAEFDDLVVTPHFLAQLANRTPTAQATILNGRLFAYRIFAISDVDSELFLIALSPIRTGGDSFVRRIVGATYPAGLVQNNQLLMEIAGAGTSDDLVAAVAEHADSIPPTGVSDALDIGEGADRRVAVIGRLAGPAGEGTNATYLAILSPETAGFAQRDLAQLLRQASQAGYHDDLNWPLFAILLAISITLSLYLPHFEVTGPQRRLTQELEAIAQGKQHQVFHETYAGGVGMVARAVARLLDRGTTRVAALHHGHGDLDTAPDVDEAPNPRTGARASLGHRAPSGGHKSRRSGGITLPPSKAPSPEDMGALPNRSERAPSDGDLFDPFDDDADFLLNDELGLPAEDRPPPPTPPAVPTPMDDGVSMPMDLRDAVGFSEPETRPGPTGPAATVEHEAPSLKAPPSRTRARAHTVVAFPAVPDEETGRDAHLQEIFQQFVETKAACGEDTSNVSFEKFARKVNANYEKLKTQKDVKDVQFSVYIKDGKAALKAKVVRN